MGIGARLIYLEPSRGDSGGGRCVHSWKLFWRKLLQKTTPDKRYTSSLRTGQSLLQIAVTRYFLEGISPLVAIRTRTKNLFPVSYCSIIPFRRARWSKFDWLFRNYAPEYSCSWTDLSHHLAGPWRKFLVLTCFCASGWDRLWMQSRGLKGWEIQLG